MVKRLNWAYNGGFDDTSILEIDNAMLRKEIEELKDENRKLMLILVDSCKPRPMPSDEGVVKDGR